MPDYALDALPPYAFPRLRSLLDDIQPGGDILNFSIGEPQHPFPDFVAKVLADNAAGYVKYPPNDGTPDWRAAALGWLGRRFNLSANGLTDNVILPLNGTREGLFGAALALTPKEKAGARPMVAMPNPFYQCYAAASLQAGAEPFYVNATADQGFLPAFTDLADDVWDRLALIYLCSPANPQGAVAGPDYLKALIEKCRAHDVMLLADECYAEIYFSDAPTSALKVAYDLDGTFSNVLTFHSLSKRSNLPGLRSGFVAGDPAAITRFAKLRAYGGAPSPLPVYAAAAAAWADDDHVIQNRALYEEKFQIADRLLANRFSYRRPDGGFFLWLDVDDGEQATKDLWAKAALRVLPGGYLAQPDDQGVNPGAAYIRVALVHDCDIIEDGLSRLLDVLG